MSGNLNKKYKRPKKKTLDINNPETSTSRTNSEKHPVEHACPLLAKDSEWVDILQTQEAGPATIRSLHEGDCSDEEEIQRENGPEMKPLAIMFPALLDKDPQTLQGMLNKAMSTTEVTRQLVDLGQKANFTFMKKTDRLIPPEKTWLESVTENSNSITSVGSGFSSSLFSSHENREEMSLGNQKGPNKKKTNTPSKLNSTAIIRSSRQSEDSIKENPDSII